MDLIDPEVVEMEDLVRRYLPDRIPRLTMGERLPVYLISVWCAFFVAATFLGATQLWALEGFPYVALLLGVMAVTVVVAEVLLRRGRRRKMAEFDEDLASGALLGAVVERFREEIETYRSRTLGADSDWARARAPLAEAKDEANRSVAYWSQRVEGEGTSELAEGQLALARRLEDTFGKAIHEIDTRAEAFRAFLNRYEAKLVPLETRRRDWEESERLARLSDRAETEVAQAKLTIGLMAREFLEDALLVANALGGLERLELLESAEHVDVNHLEAVAQRIVEVSAADRRTLAELERNLALAGHSGGGSGSEGES